jgi:hypothetical protein
MTRALGMVRTPACNWCAASTVRTGRDRFPQAEGFHDLPVRWRLVCERLGELGGHPERDAARGAAAVRGRCVREHRMLDINTLRARWQRPPARCMRNDAARIRLDGCGQRVSRVRRALIRRRSSAWRLPGEVMALCEG